VATRLALILDKYASWGKPQASTSTSTSTSLHRGATFASASRSHPMAARLAVPALLLLLLLASSAAAAAGDEGPEKVAVALYYESLCPYSASFVVDRLARVFEDGLLDAVDLTLLPYGNARVHAGGEISCQVRRAGSARYFVPTSELWLTCWLGLLGLDSRSSAW